MTWTMIALIEDAGYIYGSYVFTFAVVGGVRLAHGPDRHATRATRSTTTTSTGPEDRTVTDLTPRTDPDDGADTGARRQRKLLPMHRARRWCSSPVA